MHYIYIYIYIYIGSYIYIIYLHSANIYIYIKYLHSANIYIYMCVCVFVYGPTYHIYIYIGTSIHIYIYIHISCYSATGKVGTAWPSKSEICSDLNPSKVKAHFWTRFAKAPAD